MSLWFVDRLFESKEQEAERERRAERKRQERLKKKRLEAKQRALEMDALRENAGLGGADSSKDSKGQSAGKKSPQDPAANSSALTRGLGCGPEVASGYKHQQIKAGGVSSGSSMTEVFGQRSCTGQQNPAPGSSAVPGQGGGSTGLRRPF